ncbi:hypothetical protein ACIQYF_14500 [Pseudomonas sp. NPDC096917]|uniref:hypothetical protein n=1 Tax=Pseudomonas sp. NPDC096917 TaxID=3364483 RepID=UPI00383A2FA9
MNNSQHKNQWTQWIEENKHLMVHPVNFELRFVEQILTRIPEINPSHVKTQFPFKDQNSGNRRIDFMIINEQKGIRLAIEIDGLGKIQNQDQSVNHNRWNDLLSRQNGLLRALGCMLLRYSNKTWLNEPKFVIQEIRSELLKQEFDYSSAVKAKLRIANEKNRLEREITQKNLKIAELQKDQQSMSSAEAERTFSQKELALITEQLLTTLEKSNKPKLPESRKTPLIVFVFALIASVTIGFFMYSNSQPQLAVLTRYVTPPELDTNTSLGESNVPTNDYLSTTEASRHVGEKTTLCGRIVQIRETDKVTYLNFDKPYPNSTVTAIVWNEHAKNFSGVNQKTNSTVCIEGQISSYKGKPQITLRDRAQLITK